MASQRPNRRNAGFTLAELIVASTIMTLVMTGVYTMLSRAVSVWRSGEANYASAHEARLAVDRLRDDLLAIPKDALHLVEGSDEYLRFYTLTPPLWLDETGGAQMFQVEYVFRPGRNRSPGQLTRIETPVLGPLPAPVSYNQPNSLPAVALGRPVEVVLIENVDRFRLAYLWKKPLLSYPGAPPALSPVLRDTQTTLRLPEGLELEMHVRDTEDAGAESRVYATTLWVEGQASPPPLHLYRPRGEGKR